MYKRGFTILELLVVIAIIGVLASVIMYATADMREKAYYSKAIQEFSSINTALELYRQSNQGKLPPDVDRDLPSGLEAYLAGGKWPKGPWPGSFYDWDNWSTDTVPAVQISVRFCGSSGCRFPRQSWAKNFGVNSALYYCISGTCHAHQGDPDSTGYCVNCPVQNDPL